jgi:hypothetical protein
LEYSAIGIQNALLLLDQAAANVVRVSSFMTPASVQETAQSVTSAAKKASVGGKGLETDEAAVTQTAPPGLETGAFYPPAENDTVNQVLRLQQAKTALAANAQTFKVAASGYKETLSLLA